VSPALRGISPGKVAHINTTLCNIDALYVTRCHTAYGHAYLVIQRHLVKIHQAIGNVSKTIELEMIEKSYV